MTLLSQEAGKRLKLVSINIYNTDDQAASILGTTKENIGIQDIAVHPKSREVYLSVVLGQGLDALPTL